MEITSIEKCKRARGRYNVCLEGRFEFSLSEEVLLESGLKSGDVLSEKDIEKIKSSDEKRKALNAAFRFLSFRPRSEKELRDKLSEKSYKSEIIDAAIERLRELKYIDDEDFAKLWIKERMSQKGKIVLRQELLKKGIDKKLIEDMLEGINTDSELQAAKELVDKKRGFQRDFEREEAYKKIGGFLLRRGFNYDTVKKIIELKTKKSP